MSSPATRFRVDGMTCQNCARHVREAAESVADVAAAAVDLDAGTLRVRWKQPATAGGSESAVLETVGRAGFEIAPLGAESESGSGAASVAPGAGWLTNLRLGVPVTAFLMLAEWGLGWMHRPWYPWLAMALALPVQVVCGARFYRGAWQQLKRGASNMDTLVSLGSTAAFGFSAWIVLSGGHGHVFFMESASILTLISLGHWLEARATHRATGAIRALLDLAPPRARRLADDGSESEMDAGDLLVGERIVVRPGDRVPTDATVEDGASAVDESMLTGEAVPVEKGRGAKLYAGTANADGRLVARVTAAGADTVLAHIVAAVERAQNSRAAIQRLADQVSSVFVPVVVLLAVGTALAWAFAPSAMAAMHAALGRFLWPMTLPDGAWAAAVIHATSVLVVACPCAMGLATPAAIMAGTNAAAARGILVRDGIALEKAGRIDAVVFDKTGTLTTGQLKVVRVQDLRPENERGESLEALAGALARGSQHPVAKAIAARAPELKLVPKLGAKPAPGFLAGLRSPVLRPTPEPAWTGWREIRGSGIEVRRGAEGPMHRLGAIPWLEQAGVTGTQFGAADSQGPTGTVVGLAREDRLLGWFELADTLRPEARELVEQLTRDGFEVHLATGDSEAPAMAAASAAGIPAGNVLFRLRPEGKADALARLQGAGRRVAFVGDGLNDAPALARANLGVAVGRATDVARESADVVLLRNDLRAVRDALLLSRAALRTIHQNLFWAFFYNAASVPLAMFGFFTPVLCAAAMGLSDLLVIGNALRLRGWRPRN